ncbi:MAG: cysteine--tRNA ligase [SAR202 cluster bacterium]|nr:cysteine--tRNA ligase [SAR202 cluster bacterium]
MKISDTLTGEKRELEPAGDEVRMYVCGITPYASVHVGHAMSAIIFDMVRRYLEFRGLRVRHVQNFTDVDDKLIARANQEGTTVEALAERHIADFLDDMRRLNVVRAHEYPRASHEIPAMVEIIQGLIAKGFAYESRGDVYFRVTKDPEYGKLSHRSLDTMRAGARIEPGEQKEHPMDFALWKAAKPGEPAWDSPWGKGRPGWHIECSAMARRYLGDTIDIHGGGQDLVFPHHENEIAQSEAFTGKKPFARFWLHNGLLHVDQEKMSKSLGNLVTIREALPKFSPDAIRMSILNSHYRSPGAYSEEVLAGAERAAARLRQAAQAKGGAGAALDASAYRERFVAAMDDDFNSPQALAVLFDLARDINRAADAGLDVAAAQATLTALATQALGFTLREPAAAIPPEIVERIERLLEERKSLRAARKFAEADAVRKQLTDMGVAIKDTPAGTEWELAKA